MDGPAGRRTHGAARSSMSAPPTIPRLMSRSVRSRTLRALAAMLLTAPALAACDATGPVTAPVAPAQAPSLNVGTGKALTGLLTSPDARTSLLSEATVEITVNRGSGEICWRLSAATAEPGVEFAWESVVTLTRDGMTKYLANDPTMFSSLVDGAAPHLLEGCTAAAPELSAEDVRRLSRNASEYRVAAGFIAGNASLGYAAGTLSGVLDSGHGK
jgi:hypothetical protein